MLVREGGPPEAGAFVFEPPWGVFRAIVGELLLLLLIVM